MKTKTLLITVLLCSSIKCFSQDSLKNTLFLEALGNGGYFSLNYERQFKKQFVARVGISTFSGGIVVPLTVGKFFGEKKHHFEITAGVVYRNFYDDTFNNQVKEVLGTGFIGYRLQELNKKFQLRA